MDSMGDMDMGGMSSMGGMDMSSEGPFRPTNQKIARGYWYGIAGVVALLTSIRIARILGSRGRLRYQRKRAILHPSRPTGPVSQAWATATATLRELSYSQPVYFTGKLSKYFSPLPVGRWLVLLIYWTVLLCMLWSNTILSPSSPMYGYKWEIVGFRAAWVSVTQIPFIYLLSCKFNPISILTGISYERFNWLHRWAARTVFLTVIVHWSFFFREWWLADFVVLEMQMMPMVKYGFGAWSTVGWMVLSGFGFFRNLSYEIFVLQHIAAAATLLWLLHTHVPAYAAYNIYLAIGFVAFDWGCRIIWILLRNTHMLRQPAWKRPGYVAYLDALSGDVVRLTIDDVDFTWKAGQHVYISIPRLRPFELHPFTIANAVQWATEEDRTPDDSERQRQRLTLTIQSRSGFSKSLHTAAVKGNSSRRAYRALLSGPWGLPPDLRSYETVVMIACSTGASFVVPLLQELKKDGGCIRKVVFHWIIRSEDHFEWFGKELTLLLDAANQSRLRARVMVHVTQNMSENSDRRQIAVAESSKGVSRETSSDVASSSSSTVSIDEKTPLAVAHSLTTDGITSSISTRYGGRPSMDSMIRPSVEAATGETAVVVCGGLPVTAQARTYVANLSDERAVHKGSGAQGIFLFTETYGW